MRKKVEIVDIEYMGKIKFERLKSKNKRKLGNPVPKSNFLKKLKVNEIRKMINNKYVLEILPKNGTVSIYTTEAKNLLSPYRFDVLIKLMYIEAFDKNTNLEMAKNVYLNHIKAFNNFNEPDGEKMGAEAFINSFNSLISEMKENSFKNSVIPVSCAGEIIDGSHRLAVALYYNMKINFILLDSLDANYDYCFFINRNFERKYLDFVVDFLLEQDEFALVLTSNVQSLNKKVDIYYKECIIDNVSACLVKKETSKKVKNEIIYFGENKKIIYKTLKGESYG